MLKKQINLFETTIEGTVERKLNIGNRYGWTTRDKLDEAWPGMPWKVKRAGSRRNWSTVSADLPGGHDKRYDVLKTQKHSLLSP